MKIIQAQPLGILLAIFVGATVDRIAHAGVPATEAPWVEETGKADIPSFRFDVLPELVHNCATADGCHGSHATHSVHLDLRPFAAYSQLVDMPSEARKGAMRVKNGSVEGSFLINKIDGNLKPGEGKRMPLDELTGVPIVPCPFSDDYIEKVLKAWILAGAPNN